jgi:hypothetical protein
MSLPTLSNYLVAFVRHWTRPLLRSGVRDLHTQDYIKEFLFQKATARLSGCGVGDKKLCVHER